LSFSELSSFPGSCVEEGTQSRVPTSVALALIWNLVNTPKNYWTKISASSYSQSNITTLFRFSNFQYVSTFQPFSTYILYSNTSIFKIPNFGYQYTFRHIADLVIGSTPVHMLYSIYACVKICIAFTINNSNHLIRRYSQWKYLLEERDSSYGFLLSYSSV